MTSFKSAAVAALLLSFAVPAPAQAESFLNHLFPWIFGEPDTGPKPEDTLQAPFAKPGTPVPAPASAMQSELMNMYDTGAEAKTEGGLELPHRSTEQIGDWITNIVTQALTLNPETYTEDSQKYTGWFLPYALQEYTTYISSNQIIETLGSNNMRLTAFAESKPVLVQEGVLEGSYRWLFRVPVMLTYYDRVTTTLQGKKPTSQTQRVHVNVQVGRVPNNQLAEGMAIERWSVTKP
jgi:hypothetical protein